MPNAPITKILDGLYLGDGKSSRDATILRENSITAVLSLSVGPWVHWSQPWYKEIIIEGNHLFRRCEDSMTQDLLPELAVFCDFIEQHRASGSVLVHCDKGVSRSVTVMVAYLVQYCQYDQASALALVGGKRTIRPNENFKEQLLVWEAVHGEIWSAPGVPKTEYAA